MARLPRVEAAVRASYQPCPSGEPRRHRLTRSLCPVLRFYYSAFPLDVKFRSLILLRKELTKLSSLNWFVKKAASYNDQTNLSSYYQWQETRADGK